MINKAIRNKRIMEAVRALEKSSKVLSEAALELTIESPPGLDIAKGFDFYEAVQRFEVCLIERALLETSFNQAKAARVLGINKTTLNEKIKRYNLKR